MGVRWISYPQNYTKASEIQLVMIYAITAEEHTLILLSLQG